MATLVIGAIGQLLVAQLLSHGQKISVVVREKRSLPDDAFNHENISI